jgi:hypothetical protein
MQFESINLPRPHSPKPFEKSYGWSEDVTEYHSRDAVGLETSQEAAESFFGSNAFILHDIKPLREFFEHDHYCYGEIPCKYAQNLVLVMEYESPYTFRMSEITSDAIFSGNEGHPIPLNAEYVREYPRKRELEQ